MLRLLLLPMTTVSLIHLAKWLFETYTQVKTLMAFSRKNSVPLPERKTDFALNLAQLEHADFITANCACTKAALEKVGGFDERFKMAWREDSDLEFKFITKQIPIMPVPEALVIHPCKGGSLGN